MTSTLPEAKEVAGLAERLNMHGAGGWELVSYESIPLYGSFSSKLKGYAYLLFFKRETPKAHVSV